jgi:hypothetical protein
MHTLFDSIHCSALGSFTWRTPILDLIYEINTHIFAVINDIDYWWQMRIHLIAAADSEVGPVANVIHSLIMNSVASFNLNETDQTHLLPLVPRFVL